MGGPTAPGGDRALPTMFQAHRRGSASLLLLQETLRTQLTPLQSLLPPPSQQTRHQCPNLLGPAQSLPR